MSGSSSRRPGGHEEPHRLRGRWFASELDRTRGPTREEQANDDEGQPQSDHDQRHGQSPMSQVRWPMAAVDQPTTDKHHAYGRQEQCQNDVSHI